MSDTKNKLKINENTRINENSILYDPVFQEEIDNLVVDWFEDRVDINKEKLFFMAWNDMKKPNYTAKEMIEKDLAKELVNLTTQGVSYDHQFDKEIRELKPEWFFDVVHANAKETLYNMAWVNMEKPTSKSKTKEMKSLARSLKDYTTKSRKDTFDATFTNNVKEIRPEWFKK